MAKGLCSHHYMQARKGKLLLLRGDPLETPTRVHWVFEGHESLLIAEQERLDAQKTERATQKPSSENA